MGRYDTPSDIMRHPDLPYFHSHVYNTQKQKSSHSSASGRHIQKGKQRGGLGANCTMILLHSASSVSLMDYTTSIWQ